jgi:hypothetical protein
VVIQDGPTPNLQVLGRTPGIRPEHLAECWRAATLMPPLPKHCTPDMPGSMGIFRGEAIDYILAKAQAGPAGNPQLQYMLVPSAAMRWLSGNVRLFEAFAFEPIPQFAAPRSDLNPFVIDNIEPADAETQTEDLLTLIDACKGNLKVVGGLLAGLVQAMGLGIVNAPLSLHERITFVQGLLTLLPAPARTAITFATSVIDPSQTNSQIKFLAADMRPNRHLIYDWAAGKLLTDPPEDVYSKYIMAQLRLDTSLVLEQTNKLARTAVWRAMRKDDMANALAWVSRRASLDSAVQDGLPADRNMVAAILREDPTLPEDLRLSYSRHLIAMSLALDDPAACDIIPTLTVQNKDLAEALFEQLRNAIGTEQAMAVYHLVERWLLQPPMGVDTSAWRPLLGITVLSRATALLTGDVTALTKFLEQLLDANPALQLEPIIAQIIGLSRKRGYENADVARVVFLLAVTYLPAGGLQRLMGEAPLVAQLPEPLRAAFPHLTPDRSKAAPLSLLAKAGSVFGAERQPMILSRLVEWAMLIQRLDLVDVDALRGLTKIASSPQGARFDTLIFHVIEDLSPLNILKTLDAEVPQYLVELSMARGRYPEAIRQLEFYQNMLYKGTKQEDLAGITNSIFREVPLTIPQYTEALSAMQDSQLKPIARANAYIGALEANKWGPEIEFAARQLTSILFADPRMTGQIGVESALKLLRANATRRDAMEALRLAGALVEYALLLNEKGPDLIAVIYSLVNWSPEVSDAALEILRSYIRRAPISLAKDLPRILGEKHGEAVRRSLEAAYRLRIMLGGTDFMAFAEQLKFATFLLTDMGITYHESQDLPAIHKLRRTVEGMPGGISEDERKRLALNLNTIGQQILKLTQVASNRKMGRHEAETLRTKLLNAEVTPQNGLEALTWLGGLFGEGNIYPLDLKREAPPHMLGSRSVNMLLRETDLIVSLFNGLIDAFPEKDTLSIDIKDWTAEIDSLWRLLSLFKQRQIQGELGEDSQLLSQLIRALGEKGHERSFQSGGYGRQLQQGRAQPRSAIDALRWLNGYYAREHN